ncbi:hypothetical protein Y1Q_0002135 [Alligator mississippiensis]|uniref:Uncharacterized protein n=1 Tax=Alligator mississippiensis TaxID=8496 RepID=A0A151MPN8_ALLMI|nr:hypothetical protein Y1Q_0002135 [Alligator mississippiensis]
MPRDLWGTGGRNCSVNCNSQKPPEDWRNKLQCALQLPKDGRRQEEVKEAVSECGEKIRLITGLLHPSVLHPSLAAQLFGNYGFMVKVKLVSAAECIDHLDFPHTNLLSSGSISTSVARTERI